MSTELSQVPFSRLVLKNSQNSHSHHQSQLWSLTLQPRASLSGIWLVARWDHLIFLMSLSEPVLLACDVSSLSGLILFLNTFSSLIIYTTVLLTGSNSFSWWHSPGQIQVSLEPNAYHLDVFFTQNYKNILPAHILKKTHHHVNS